MKESEDVQRAQQRVTEEREKLEQFDQQLQEELAGIGARYDTAVELDRVAMAPKRGQVQVLFVGLGWQ